MLDVYLPTPLPAAPILPFLPGGRQYASRLFQFVPESAYDGIFRSVPLTEAAYVLIPHDYGVLSKSYLAACLAEAKTSGKRTILFSFQDDPAPLVFPDTLIFRPSAYKSRLSPNEIVLPGLVEDLGSEHGYTPILKGERATVGFVGKAGFANVRERLRYYLRDYMLRQGPEREGLYYRRRALASLRRTKEVTLNDRIRRQFSANRKTAELPVEQLRSEYIESLRESLFTLTPRGDGNYSLRFYETLSMGRIPILIDTDMSLPLEDRIPYDSFILRIPWQKVDMTGEIVTRFFNDTSDEELQAMQKAARSAFTEYLSMPAYLRTVCTPAYLDAVSP